MTQAADNKVDTAQIKAVPQDQVVRVRIRETARGLAKGLDRGRPLRRPELESLATDLLTQSGLEPGLLGFAMVAIDNEFWRRQFAAVPPHKRILLLPHCLRDKAKCRGSYSEDGLACAGCGTCCIHDLKGEAESLGYEVVIAEGTPPVVQKVLSGRCDAVLGVACLDSLDKAFRRISELGMPHMAVPLLRDGCEATAVEADYVQELMRLKSAETSAQTRGYVPLLRAAARLFQRDVLAELLAPHVEWPPEDLGKEPSTEAIAMDWLLTGGKRFRPFLTLAAYASAAYGAEALDAGSDVAQRLPQAARRVALAVEVLHKASLTHDDVEDNDLYRYGADTLHRRYGIPVAINIGDYLVGLGYRLIAAEQESLGSDCTADILNHLSEAHVKLAQGQGMELNWLKNPPKKLRPIDVLQAYALKTAPAFEAAFYMGTRMAGPDCTPARLRPYCRNLGVAYQAKNDLKDWDEDQIDKVVVGQDALAARPTILKAFALERADDSMRTELAAAAFPKTPQTVALTRVREIYDATGAFGRTEGLIDKCRDRAMSEAEQEPSGAVRDLMQMVVDVMV